MNIACATDFIDLLRGSQLLKPEQLEEAERALQHHYPDPNALCRELERRGWLTSFQNHLLLRGQGRHLLLGQYVLLKRLGQGGMGQVFKARHRILERIVAIKLLRKEILNHPTAIPRFQREVQAVAKVSHPNIVHAFDADQVGSMHFLVMEYVEGVNVARLVHEAGPLPLAQACDYIRQTAEGLQHVHERGLVHRDIKPSNLLVVPTPDTPVAHGGRTSRWGTLKILDLGLARLTLMEECPGDATQQGTIMGSPDYIAPEQVRNAHEVDIRADLYGLGCTFYLLLTGQVPFPKGTLTEKLHKHQHEAVQRVERLRPDIPVSVADIVHKLLAKRPEDRFQTPRELAIALASLAVADSGGHDSGAVELSGAADDKQQPQPAAGDEASSTCWAEVTAAATPVLNPRADSRRFRIAASWRLLVYMAAGLFVAGGILALMLLLSAQVGAEGAGRPNSTGKKTDAPAPRKIGMR